MPHFHVLDSTLYYEDTGAIVDGQSEGTGTAFVFLHGNPASSHLWRKVLPRLSGLGRCLALI